MATIVIDKNIMVPMRDGVQLATDVYRLEGASLTPVLVVRAPYNKDDYTSIQKLIYGKNLG
jgi:predicted acyl esterase